MDPFSSTRGLMRISTSPRMAGIAGWIKELSPGTTFSGQASTAPMSIQTSSSLVVLTCSGAQIMQNHGSG